MNEIYCWLSYKNLLELILYIKKHNTRCIIYGCCNTSTRFAAVVNNNTIEQCVKSHEYNKTTDLYTIVKSKFETKFRYYLKINNKDVAVQIKLMFGSK